MCEKIKNTIASLRVLAISRKLVQPLMITYTDAYAKQMANSPPDVELVPLININIGAVTLTWTMTPGGKFYRPPPVVFKGEVTDQYDKDLYSIAFSILDEFLTSQVFTRFFNEARTEKCVAQIVEQALSLMEQLARTLKKDTNTPVEIVYDWSLTNLVQSSYPVDGVTLPYYSKLQNPSSTFLN